MQVWRRSPGGEVMVQVVFGGRVPPPGEVISKLSPAVTLPLKRVSPFSETQSMTVSPEVGGGPPGASSQVENPSWLLTPCPQPPPIYSKVMVVMSKGQLGSGGTIWLQSTPVNASMQVMPTCLKRYYLFSSLQVKERIFSNRRNQAYLDKTLYRWRKRGNRSRRRSWARSRVGSHRDVVSISVEKTIPIGLVVLEDGLVGTLRRSPSMNRCQEDDSDSGGCESHV
jgi:hypothetical protein